MPTVARRSLALALSAVCLLLIGASAARAEIYWVNSDTDSIGRATNAGGSANKTFASGGTDLGGVTTDGRYLYWSQWFGGIARANLDGSAATPFITTPAQAGSLATDGEHIYWVVPNEPRISRARVDGSDVETDFVVLDDGGMPDGIATDGSHLYWTDSQLGRVGRIRPDGTGSQPALVTGLDTPTGLAVAGGYLYWADSGEQALGRARTDGSGLARRWLSTTSVPNGIAVAGGYVYWSQPVAGSINRATTAAAGSATLINGLDWPMGLLVTAPGFSAAPSAPAFGNVVVGKRATQTVTVTNDATAWAGQPLTFGAGAVTLTGTNANQFSIAADGCSGQSIAPGATCTVEVTFAPTSTGAKSASLRFADNAPNSPQSLAMSGRGTQGTASLSTTTGAFGEVRTGTHGGTQSFTITNSAVGANAGAITYAADAVTLTGANTDQFWIDNDGCSGTAVAPSASCTVDVSFIPTSDGAASASLRFADDAPGSPRTVALSGTGITPALEIAPATHDFGDVRYDRTSAPVAFTVRNTGNASVDLPGGAVHLTGSDPSSFSIDDDQCSGTTLASGDDCTVEITFTPDGYGSRSAALEVTGDEASASAALSGSGTAPLIFAASGGGPPFGTVLVGSSSEPSGYGIYNAGSGPAFVAADGVWLDGDDAAQFEIVDDDCSGTTLATGEQCLVKVVFSPTEAGGATARLHFDEDDSVLYHVDLYANAVDPEPALGLTPSTHDFGSVLVDTTAAPVELTVANSGTAAATLPANAVAITAAGASATFSATDDECSGATLDPGEHCTVSVSFSPHATGVATATVAIDDGSGGTLRAALTGTGEEPRRDPEPEPEPRRDPQPQPEPRRDPAPRTDPPTTPAPTPPIPLAPVAPTPPTPARRTPRAQLTTSVGNGAIVVGANGTMRLRCEIAGAKLRGCAAVVTPAGGGSALGGGPARPGSGGRWAIVAARLDGRGRAALASALGGVRAVVTITATTRDGKRIVKRVRVTLFAKRQQVVTLPGAFAPDGAALTPAGERFLRDVARSLRGQRAIVCTGFTATRGEQGSDEAAAALGLARGRSACALLRRLGVRAQLTARSGGRGEPLAGNGDEDGRARNRRVELTITR